MSVIDWVLAIPKALVSYGLSWFMVIAFIAVVVFVIYLITLPVALVDKLKEFLESRSKRKKDH